MAYILWTEAMSVGVPELDADHRSLFRILEMLEAVKSEGSTPEAVATVLRMLAAYGRKHFAREERVMTAIGFPALGFHRVEHAGFCRHIDSLREAARSGIQELPLSTLSDYLTNWLRHHILIQDMAFKPYVRPLDEIDVRLDSLPDPDSNSDPDLSLVTASA